MKKDVKCDSCERSFTFASDLKKHVSGVHDFVAPALAILWWIQVSLGLRRTYLYLSKSDL